MDMGRQRISCQTGLMRTAINIYCLAANTSIADSMKSVCRKWRQMYANVISMSVVSLEFDQARNN